MPILPRFTDAGKALQLRALDGEKIKFTKIQMGSGTLGETSYKTFNALLEPKVTVPITDISISNGYAAIRGYFNNEKLTEGFYYRELGLFAQDPDDSSKEILYCYGNSGNYASFIAEPGSVLIERSIKIIAVVDDAENVSAIINGSAVYVDFADMKKAIEEHNTNSQAHADMFNQSLTLYVDCNSTEDTELCDGSYEHPLKNISDVVPIVPSYIKNLRVVLKKSGNYILNDDVYFGYNELENVEVAYNGTATNKPVVFGSIYFGSLKSVSVSNVNFSNSHNVWSSNSAILFFDDCNTVRIDKATTQCSTTDYCVFIECYSSNIYLNNSTVLNVHSAATVYDNSVIHISNCTIDTIDESIQCYDSTVYMYDKNNATYLYSGGIIFTPDIMEKITDGTLIEHINSTANPHHVNLEQAQREGGVVGVVHGGTGQTSFSTGALLKGNGTDAVEMVSGVGAVYAEESGDPKFGTLPVSMGGTGRTSISYGSVLVGGSDKVSTVVPSVGAFFAKNNLQAPNFGTLPGNCGGTGFSKLDNNSLLIGDSGNNVLQELKLGNGVLYNDSNFLRYGVVPTNFGGTGQKEIYYSFFEASAANYRGRHVQFIVPGTNILVWAGRIVVSAGSTFDCHISWSGDKKFSDDTYALILSNADIPESKVERHSDYFHVEAQTIGDRVADFVAIGKAAS